MLVTLPESLWSPSRNQRSHWTGILSDGAIRDERDRIKALERENKELRRVNEILNLASALFAQAEFDSKLKS